jgi:5-methylcytosine-specific restriction endonuclease McrA
MEIRRRYTEEEKRAIFDRSRGKCNCCHKQLSFNNHGVHRARGAWHIDHSKAIANGGTNHGNNLRAVCISCNLDKSTVTARTARRWNGRKRAPLSGKRFEEAKAKNAVAGGAIGATIGGIFGGPVGAFFGGAVGAALGHQSDPDE